MEQNNIVKQLLLADYFIQQWYTFLDYKYPDLNDFLADTTIVTINKIMYFMCVASVQENSRGLFETFDFWDAVPKGPVCDDFYSNYSCLYCLKYFEKRFCLRQEIGVVNLFADTSYKKVIPDKIKTTDEFNASVRLAFPLETALIDSSLKRIIAFPFLNRLIVNNLSKELIELSLKLPIWNKAYRCTINRMEVDNLEYLQIEKKTLFSF